MDIKKMAKLINKMLKDQEYFWAAGLIRETITLWSGGNKELLCKEGQIMAEKIWEGGC